MRGTLLLLGSCHFLVWENHVVVIFRIFRTIVNDTLVQTITMAVNWGAKWCFRCILKPKCSLGEDHFDIWNFLSPTDR